MIPRQITVADSTERSMRMVSEWIRDVQTILTGNVKIADQFSETRTFTFNSDIAPMSVSLPFFTAPTTVWTLRATKPGETAVQSGNRITWEWGQDAQLIVVSIDGLDASTDYTVTILAMEGADQ